MQLKYRTWIKWFESTGWPEVSEHLRCQLTFNKTIASKWSCHDNVRLNRSPNAKHLVSNGFLFQKSCSKFRYTLILLLLGALKVLACFFTQVFPYKKNWGICMLEIDQWITCQPRNKKLPNKSFNLWNQTVFIALLVRKFLRLKKIKINQNVKNSGS